MTFIRSFMLLALLLGTAAIARADDGAVIHSLRYCNVGEMNFSVAVAAKMPGGWFSSDEWNTYGWFTIKPGECTEVYHHDEFNSRSPTLHVAFAFTDSTGVWGDAHLNFKDLKSSYQFCGTRADFSYPYETPYSCPEPQFMIPASIDYVKLMPSNCPGCKTSMADLMNRANDPLAKGIPIELTSKDRARPIKGYSGTAPSSSASNSGSNSAADGSGSSSGTTAKSKSDPSGPTVGDIIAGIVILGAAAAIAANMDTAPKPFEAGTLNASLLGRRIVRRSSSGSDWYYDDGSRVNSAYELGGKTASYLMDAPTQRPTSDPEVAAAFRSLQQALASCPYNRRTEIEPTGRLAYTYTNQGSEYLTIVNLSALDFKQAGNVPPTSKGVVGFGIPCKENQLCVASLYQGKVEIHDNFYVFFVGDDKAEAVWRPLMKLIDLYPAEPRVAVR